MKKKRLLSARVSRTVVEELCEDGRWRPFNITSWMLEKPGEYTVTLRVRVFPKKLSPHL